MNKMDFAEQLLLDCKALGATDSEVVIGESADLGVTVRNGALEEVNRAESAGFGLRVFVGKRSAVISASKFEESKTLAERAVSMAKLAPEDEFAGLASPDQFYTGELDLEVFDGEEPEEARLIEMSKTVEGTALAVEGITNSEGGDASYSKYSNILATSNGFLREHKSSRCSLSVRVLAGVGTEMQRDYDYSAARFMADLGDPVAIGENAARLVLEKMNPRKVSSGKFPVVFDPRVSKNLVGDLSSGINGASVARGTSFLKNKMGEQLFGGGINIVDDPLILRGQASKPFDGEGVGCKKLTVIKDGVLQTWLLDIRSANQLKLQSNGRASRGSAAQGSPSSTNLYMENGTVSPADLIGGIKSGFYVTEAFGMGINYTNGDYSQGASGFWIENGELAYPVNEVTIASNLLEMFQGAVPADDLVMKYSVNAPTILINEMTLAGK